MSNWISVVVILGLIVVGVIVISLMNGQHRNRVVTYGFGPGQGDGDVERGDVERGDLDRSHGLHRLSGLISGRVRRRRTTTR